MKQYKLKKDLPGIPAGTIGETDDYGNVKFVGKLRECEYVRYFMATEIAAWPDFFHDMDTPEPETPQADPWNVPAKQEPAAEPTIGELLAIREHFYHEPGDYAQAIQRKTEKLLNARLGLKWTELPEFPHPNPTQKTDSEPKKEGI